MIIDLWNFSQIRLDSLTKGPSQNSNLKDLFLEISRLFSVEEKDKRLPIKTI